MLAVRRDLSPNGRGPAAVAKDGYSGEVGAGHILNAIGVQYMYADAPRSGLAGRESLGLLLWRVADRDAAMPIRLAV